MGHIDTEVEGQLKECVPDFDGAVNDVHRELAGGIGELFELQEFELDAEVAVLHFECARDLLIRDYLVDDTIEAVAVAFGVGCDEMKAAMRSVFQLQHLCAHPLLDDSGFDICPEEEFHGQVKFPRNEDFLLAVFGTNLCLVFHGDLFFAFVLFHDRFKPVEPVFPEFPEGLDEVRDLFHLLRIQVIIDLPAALLLCEQFALSEDLQVS